MLRSRTSTLLLLLALAAAIQTACSKNVGDAEISPLPLTEQSRETQLPQPNTSQAEIQATGEAIAATVKPKNLIPTTPFSPTPIRISIASLPKPYSTESASRSPQVVAIPASPTLKVPAGFTVNVFADGLNKPRWLALTPTGDVLVTETPDNRITLLRDTNGDGATDLRQAFATQNSGLDIPFGMTFTNGYFFVGNTGEVRRFPYTKGQQQITGNGQKIATLTPGGYNQHWTRNVVASPDGRKLYVSIGSRSNASEEPLPRASVQEMNLDGSGQKTFTSGLRNPVGLDFHPVTRELYTTVNERDALGDDLVPDYLTRIRQGEYYGWPYAYLSPTLLDPRHVQNGRSSRPDLVAQTRSPDVLFQAHSAALGLRFYQGQTFPQKYRNGAFVAFRGSWNRDQGTGYKIVFVPFNAEGRPQGYYENFLTGFLLNASEPKTWGRPVGLLTLPDGSLIFTDEGNNRIYRIQYAGA